MFPLLRRQRPRQLDVGRRVEVAELVRPADGGHAVAFEAEHLSVLRRRRNLQAQRSAADRLDVDLTPEDRRGERNRHMRIEVAAAPLELGMRRHPDAQVEIARMSAAGSVLAFAADADARSVRDTGRNADIDVAGLPILTARQPPPRAAVGTREPDLDLLLDI